MYKRTLFAVLAVLLMPLLTTYAQDSAEMNFYTDSEDRYRIPVPNGWELSEQDELVTITGPDENITVQVLVLPLQDDIEQNDRCRLGASKSRR